MARDCYDDCIAFLDEQLGRLLDELERQGLLDNTDVIITSDHGEAFGDHGIFGHAYSVYLDEIGVPLVILSPGAPAGRRSWPARSACATCRRPWSTCWGSRPAHRSRAARWRPTGGRHPGEVPPEITTPAFSEQASRTAFQTAARPRRAWLPGFQMSLVASGHHYIRDGAGGEQLYDLLSDPFERINLMESPGHGQEVGAFRRMLLEVLTDNPGSVEVEEAYLDSYRASLKSLVRGGAQRIPGNPLIATGSR